MALSRLVQVQVDAAEGGDLDLAHAVRLDQISGLQDDGRAERLHGVERGVQDVYRLPVIVTGSTYAFGASVTIVAAVASALVVRRKLDDLDLVAVLKARE
jgi:ABC-type antimicrobial peptide transport system permease subunit